MRKFVLLFLLSIQWLKADVSPFLYEHQGLQDWYLALQNFERVDLESPLLADCSKVEMRFAKMQYHWQQMLRGANRSYHQERLAQIKANALEGGSDQILIDRVLNSFFLARAAALQGKGLASLSSYWDSFESMEQLLAKQSAPEEIKLVQLIYALAYQEFSSNPLYWSLTVLMPSPPQRVKPAQLEALRTSESPIVSSEAAYFAYRLQLEDRPQQAQENLKYLVERYPDNWIYRIEYFKHYSQDKDLERPGILQGIEASAKLLPNEKAFFSALLVSL